MMLIIFIILFMILFLQSETFKKNGSGYELSQQDFNNDFLPIAHESLSDELIIENSLSQLKKDPKFETTRPMCFYG